MHSKRKRGRCEFKIYGFPRYFVIGGTLPRGSIFSFQLTNLEYSVVRTATDGGIGLLVINADLSQVWSFDISQAVKERRGHLIAVQTIFRNGHGVSTDSFLVLEG